MPSVSIPRPTLPDAIFLLVFRRALGRRLRRTPGVRARALVAAARGRAVALVEANAGRVVDRPSASHLRVCAAVAGAYMALRTELHDDAAAFAIVREVWLGAAAGPPAWLMRWLPWLTRDPFRFTVKVSKTKQTAYYGISFRRRVEQDDDDAYRMTVTECFYQRFFVDLGVPELAPMFCEKDFDWAGAIDPRRHGFAFARPTTLAAGGDGCRFEMRRVARAGAR
ncbi:MAG: L-2-amino-thiazoline-4-carboxylic acid hydrolase [Myxococcales bacterium]|nr:L-2-amino-thiazoline-4-carboxylic acid hydrolase [Myxococcales bacterium]